MISRLNTSVMKRNKCGHKTLINPLHSKRNWDVIYVEGSSKCPKYATIKIHQKLFLCTSSINQ